MSGKAGGFAGPTSGCHPTARQPSTRCARHGSAPKPSASRSHAPVDTDEPARHWPASQCWTGYRPVRRLPTSGSDTPHAPWRHPGNAASSPASSSPRPISHNAECPATGMRRRGAGVRASVLALRDARTPAPLLHPHPHCRAIRVQPASWPVQIPPPHGDRDASPTGVRPQRYPVLRIPARGARRRRLHRGRFTWNIMNSPPPVPP